MANAMTTDLLLNRLSDEVLRIISSPYPVSLKTLHDILSFDKNRIAFNSFSSRNPCKIKQLASAVLETSEARQFDLDLLNDLCADDAFRTYLLEQNPSLLQALLSKALIRRGVYNQLCVQVLRHPLPEAISLPAVAEDFFIATVKEAIQHPTKITLSSVYDLLSGACQNFPRLLPRRDWSSLESELVKIVKSSKTIQDQALSLLSLGILSWLARSSRITGEQDITDSSAFFTGSKALKSLSLVCLQAVWVVKATDNLSKADLSRSLNIILHVFDAIKPETIRIWVQSHDGKLTVARLVSKCVDPVLEVDLRLHLLAVCSIIHQASPFSSSILMRLEAFVLSEAFTSADSTFFTRVIQLSLPVLAVDINFTSWETVIQRVLQAASPHSKATVSQLANLASLIETLCSIVEANPTLSERLIVGFETVDEVHLQSFLDVRHTTVPCDSESDCRNAPGRARRELIEKFTAFWLSTVIYSGLKGARSMATNSKHIITLMKGTTSTYQVCPVARIIPKASSALVEQKSAEADSFKGSWKDRLKVLTEQETAWREKQLIQVVGSICADLEERCETAERPHRDANFQLAKLKDDYTQLEHEKNELEGKVNDLNVQLGSAESEKVALEDALQSENNQLVENVQNLEKQLIEAKEDMKLKFEQAAFDSQAKEFELRSYIIQLETRCEALTADISHKNRCLSDSEATLDQTRGQLTELSKRYEEMDNKIRQQDHQLDEEIKVKGRLEQELEALHESDQQLRKLLEDLQREHEQLRLHTKQAAEGHQDEILNLKTELRDQANNITNMRNKTAEEKHTFDVQLEQVSALLIEEQSKVQQLLQEQKDASSKNFEQRKENNRLRQELNSRDEEIAEFQAMRMTLVTAIGQLPGKKDARKNVHYISSVQHLPTSRTHDATRLTEQAEISQLTIKSDDGPTRADGSFGLLSSPDGSTPKRPKPGKPFKMPITRQRQSTTTISRNLNRVLRPPLNDVSAAKGNRSPTRHTLPAKAMKVHSGLDGVEEGALDDIDAFEFGSEIFTSTPLTPRVQSTREIRNDDTMDE